MWREEEVNLEEDVLKLLELTLKIIREGDCEDKDWEFLEKFANEYFDSTVAEGYLEFK